MVSARISSPFAELLDFLPDVLAWVKDRQGRYLWVNRAFVLQYALDHPDGNESASVEQSRQDRLRPLAGVPRRSTRARPDRTRLGIIFSKTPPKERGLTLSAVNDTFKIPPGHPNYRVDASFEVGTDVKLASLHPHMHGRGKDFEYRAVFPNGKTDILLRVPRFDWHWQQWYTLEKAIPLPKGTRIDCTAHFDNSPNNPETADPTKEVTWGDQSWDEMMVGFFNLVFDANLPVDRVFVKKPKAEIAGNSSGKTPAPLAASLP